MLSIKWIFHGVLFCEQWAFKCANTGRQNITYQVDAKWFSTQIQTYIHTHIYIYTSRITQSLRSTHYELLSLLLWRLLLVMVADSISHWKLNDCRIWIGMYEVLKWRHVALWWLRSRYYDADDEDNEKEDDEYDEGKKISLLHQHGKFGHGNAKWHFYWLKGQNFCLLYSSDMTHRMPNIYMYIEKYEYVLFDYV